MPDIPDVVQAKAFQLVNDDGDVIAELKTAVLGDPSFVLFDGDGQRRLVAELNGGDPELTITNGDGHMQFEVSFDESGNIALTLGDQDGEPRLKAFVDEAGQPQLHLAD